MTTRSTVETPHVCGYCHGIHDPAQGVRVGDDGLRAALEAEWYNGNIPEDAYLRLCAAAGTEPYLSAQPAPPDGQVWAEQMIDRWSPDERSRAIEARARELAGAVHVHGAIPAQFWRRAIEEMQGIRVEQEAFATPVRCGGSTYAGMSGIWSTGCGEGFRSVDELFRCADCAVPFHRDCLRRHFGENHGINPEVARS